MGLFVPVFEELQIIDCGIAQSYERCVFTVVDLAHRARRKQGTVRRPGWETGMEEDPEDSSMVAERPVVSGASFRIKL